MQRIYSMWKTYVLLVSSVVFAYSERTDHLPFPVSFGFLLLLMLSVDLFFPRWASLSIFTAVGLPLAWLLGTMFWWFFVYSDNRSER